MAARWTNLLLPGVTTVADQVPVYADAWQASNRIALEADGRLWVVLGDSLSQGIGASSHLNGWVGQTHVRLRELGRDYRVLNFSKSGATTSDVRHRQLSVLSRLPHAPAVVTLLVGANDMLRRSTRSTLLDNFQEILEQMPSQSVVAYLPQPVRLAHRVNAAIDQAARARGFQTVNLRPAARHFRGHRAADLFHPNDRGYRRISDVFVQAMTRDPHDDPTTQADSGHR